MFASLKMMGLQGRASNLGRRSRRFALRPVSEGLERRDLMAVGLDPTFGQAGIALVASVPNTATTSVFNSLSNVALQSDGKIVAIGSRYTSSTTDAQDILLERHNTNGTLDTTFGAGGTTTLTVRSGSDALDSRGVGVVIQPDGKIVVLGSTSQRDGSTTSINDFAVARFNANGSIDASFGANGTGYRLVDFTPATSMGDASDSPTSIALAPGGKIVVAGSTFTTASVSQDMAVARLLDTGVLDTSFSGDGKEVIAFDLGGSKNDIANAVVVGADGKVVVVGTVGVANILVNSVLTSTTDIGVARLTTDGVLDGTFGTGGKTVVLYNLGGDSRDEGSAVALVGDKVVLAGTSNLSVDPTFVSPSIYAFNVTRLNTNGSLDTTFSGSGKFSSGLPGTSAIVNGDDVSMAVLADSTLLIVGGANTGSSTGSAMFLANVQANGGLNTSYATGGIALLPGADRSGNIAVQTDGKIVFANGSGIVRTTAPTPRVVSAQFVPTGTGRKARNNSIKVKFNTALNPGLAGKKTSYSVRMGKKGKSILEIKRVTYDPTTFETTILLKQAVPKGKPVQVFFSGLGIAGMDSQLLNNGADTFVTVTSPTTATASAKRRA